MEDEAGTVHPETILVPAEGGRAAITQGELERLIADLFSVDGELADLCVYSAAIIGTLAERIQRSGLSIPPTQH